MTSLADGSQDQARPASPNRFYGHLNPETVLREQLEDRRHGPANECGYWAPSVNQAKSNGLYASVAATSDAIDDRTTKDALAAYLEAAKVSRLPPKQHLDRLTQLYFCSIQPILPIVDEQDFVTRRNDGDQSIILTQAICLVISKHDDALPDLFLHGLPSLQIPRAFGREINRSIQAALNAGTEKDRIILIQVLALLSLYVEGPNGAEQASMHLAIAVHHAHTIGMQFGRARADDRSEYLHRLFWCLVSLDVINAYTNGRPRMMHDQDNRLENPVCAVGTKDTPFGVWLRISMNLDKVLMLYRPGTQVATGREDHFQGFEEMVGAHGNDYDPRVLGMRHKEEISEK